MPGVPVKHIPNLSHALEGRTAMITKGDSNNLGCFQDCVQFLCIKLDSFIPWTHPECTGFQDHRMKCAKMRLLGEIGSPTKVNPTKLLSPKAQTPTGMEDNLQHNMNL